MMIDYDLGVSSVKKMKSNKDWVRSIMISGRNRVAEKSSLSKYEVKRIDHDYFGDE